jgi:hypothetical protein
MFRVKKMSQYNINTYSELLLEYEYFRNDPVKYEVESPIRAVEASGPVLRRAIR